MMTRLASIFDQSISSLTIALIGVGAYACLISPATCLAAPEEIQVYLDEFAAPGAFGLDFHTNYVARADRGSSTRQMLRVTPELSYGINEHWEAALYWLTSSGPEQSAGLPVTDGVKLRFKWRPRAPANTSPWYGAINFEVGQLSKRFSVDGTIAEVKFIGMFSQDPWILGANLNIDRALSSNPSLGLTTELDTKISYRLSPGQESDPRLGLENYAYFGPLRQQLSTASKFAATYLVADFSVKTWDFNLGLGKVRGAGADRWVVKAIIGVPLK
jgi:hypothetical protein